MMAAWMTRRAVGTRQDLARFVNDLRLDLETSSDAWENPTLDRYLEALDAWLTDLDGAYLNRGEPLPDQPDWSLVARMLVAASMYE